MTIWIDPPQWPAHGRLWSHLISDSAIEELHDFAARIGIPRRGFEGDHYDIPAERYADVVAAGARETDGRDLLKRLTDSGLRMAKRKGDKGIERVPHVEFPDGTSATIDLIASPREMTHERVFAAMVFVQDATRAHLITWSERRKEWGACGGWREGPETPLETAVREAEEESGLLLDPMTIRPVAYERFHRTSDDAAAGVGMWVPGQDILQVYATVLTEERPPVRGEVPGQPPPEWVVDDEFARRCRDAFWWPVAREILAS